MIAYRYKAQYVAQEKLNNSSKKLKFRETNFKSPKHQTRMFLTRLNSKRKKWFKKSQKIAFEYKKLQKSNFYS